MRDNRRNVAFFEWVSAMTAKTSLVSVLAATAMFSFPMAASAQDVASGSINAFPTIFGANSAFPAPSNTGFAALTFANPRVGAFPGSDGELTFGYTFGSPISGVSVTAGVNVLSLEDNFADSGDLFLSVARSIGQNEYGATMIGASFDDLLGWGAASGGSESYSVYVSHLTSLGAGRDVPVQFTFGYGNETTVADDGTGAVGDGFFAGVGVGVAESLAVSMSLTETSLNIGATASIPAVDGLSVTAGFYDVTDNTDRQQFALTVGFQF